LIGSGPESCHIDGRKNREFTERPLHPYQSLVLLGNGASISGFTVRNSGGVGVASEQGARALITGNIIRDNHHHGIVIFGTNGATIYGNRLVNNGTGKEKFRGPRPDIGRQGHHIYFECRFGCTNEIAVIDNIMEKVTVDGIANDMYDQEDGLSMRLQVIGNEITGCGRNGLSIVSSYDPSRTQVWLDVHKNRILQTTGNAIDLVSSFSIVNRPISEAKIVANVVGNEISDCGYGIVAVGAYEASINCRARYNILQNNIQKAREHGIYLVGGYNTDNLAGWAVHGTVVEAVIANNRIVDAGKTPVCILGGVQDKNGEISDNRVFVNIVENEIVDGVKRRKPRSGIVVRDGKSQTNSRVIVLP
jgi:parallel beta-helix repeat protein